MLHPESELLIKRRHKQEVFVSVIRVTASLYDDSSIRSQEV
jgi:hypothetical protein